MTFRPTRLTRTFLLAAFGAAPLPGCRSAAPPATRPASEIGTTERERDMRRALASKPLGYLDALLLQSTWLFDDLSDQVSGSPARYAGMMEAKNAPDLRRQGIMSLADRPWAQRPPYTTRYAQIAAEERADYLVRASAIRALSRSRSAGHTDLFVRGLGDENDWVRLESAKALNRLPDAAAVPGLLKVVARPDENKDIRIAAAEALRHHKRLEVGRALAAMLAERDFGVAWQAHRSLRDVTRGKDFGYDEGAWLAYFNSPAKPLG